jgi:opacity protein-like surface antigen
MKKIFIMIVMACLFHGLAQAQEGMKPSIGYTPVAYYSFYWNTTFPMGDLHDWVSQPSPAGFGFAGRYLVKDGLTAGFDFAWQRISKIYDATTYTIPEKGLAINARNYRFTWMVPFQAVVGYHLMADKAVSPYVTLGIGGDYMEHHLMIQEYDIYSTYWDFSLTPEVGFMAKFGAFSEWGAQVGFNYKWTTNKIELYQQKSENLQMLNLKVGLSYVIR